MRLCQPFPVALKACMTLDDSRIVVETLGLALTLPVGRPARRAAIYLGV